MKQRLGVAAALLGDPELLILDEPTNGLDPAGMADMRALSATWPPAGQTVLLSSHLLAEVQQICDRVGVISGGRDGAGTRGDDGRHCEPRQMPHDFPHILGTEYGVLGARVLSHQLRAPSSPRSAFGLRQSAQSPPFARFAAKERVGGPGVRHAHAWRCPRRSSCPRGRRRCPGDSPR